MFRAALAALVNGLLALLWALALPFRLFRREAPAVYVRFRLEGDPPYRKVRGARKLFQLQTEPDTVGSLDEALGPTGRAVRGSARPRRGV